MKNIVTVLLITPILLFSETLQNLVNLPKGTIVALTEKIAIHNSKSKPYMEDGAAKIQLITSAKNVVPDSTHYVIGQLLSASENEVRVKPFYIKQSASIILEPRDTSTLPSEYPQSEFNKVLYRQYKRKQSEGVAQIVTGGTLFGIGAVLHATYLKDEREDGQESPRIRSMGGDFGSFDIKVDYRPLITPILYASAIPFTVSGIMKLKRSKHLKSSLQQKNITMDLQVNPLRREVSLIGEF